MEGPFTSITTPQGTAGDFSAGGGNEPRGGDRAAMKEESALKGGKKSATSVRRKPPGNKGWALQALEGDRVRKRGHSQRKNASPRVFSLGDDDRGRKSRWFVGKRSAKREKSHRKGSSRDQAHGIALRQEKEKKGIVAV